MAEDLSSRPTPPRIGRPLGREETEERRQEREKLEAKWTQKAQEALSEITTLLESLAGKMHEREFPESQTNVMNRISGIVRGIRAEVGGDGRVAQSFHRVLAKDLGRPHFDRDARSSDGKEVGHHLQIARTHLGAAIEKSRAPISTYTEFPARADEILKELSDMKQKGLKSRGRDLREENVAPYGEHTPTSAYLDEVIHKIGELLLDTSRTPQEKLKAIGLIVKLPSNVKALLEKALDPKNDEYQRAAAASGVFANNNVGFGSIDKAPNAAKVEFWLKKLTAELDPYVYKPGASERTEPNLRIFFDIYNSLDRSTDLHKKMDDLAKRRISAQSSKADAARSGDEGKRRAAEQAFAAIELEMSQFVAREFMENSTKFAEDQKIAEFNAAAGEGKEVSSFDSTLSKIDELAAAEDKVGLEKAYLLAASLAPDKKGLKTLRRRLDNKSTQKLLDETFRGKIVEIATLRLNGTDEKIIRELLTSTRAKVRARAMDLIAISRPRTTPTRRPE